MREQIIDLEDQICKYKSLIQDLSDKKNELNAQKTDIRHTLQLLCNELSTDESDIPVTRMLPNTNITRNQQTAQNPRKRVASDLIEQTSDLSENHTEVNLDISAKKIDIAIQQIRMIYQLQILQEVSKLHRIQEKDMLVI